MATNNAPPSPPRPDAHWWSSHNNVLPAKDLPRTAARTYDPFTNFS